LKLSTRRFSWKLVGRAIAIRARGSDGVGWGKEETSVKPVAEHCGGVTVLSLEGKLTVDHSARELSRTVRELAETGRIDVVLDLAGVDLVDSLGIEALVASHICVTRRGGRLAVAGLAPRVRYLLDITRLSGVIEIHSDRDHALASFPNPRP
jgi:anti-sigma B factor antagonist